jgi:hypothetical protein
MIRFEEADALIPMLAEHDHAGFEAMSQLVNDMLRSIRKRLRRGMDESLVIPSIITLICSRLNEEMNSEERQKWIWAIGFRFCDMLKRAIFAEAKREHPQASDAELLELVRAKYIAWAQREETAH